MPFIQKVLRTLGDLGVGALQHLGCLRLMSIEVALVLLQLGRVGLQVANDLRVQPLLLHDHAQSGELLRATKSAAQLLHGRMRQVVGL